MFENYLKFLGADNLKYEIKLKIKMSYYLDVQYFQILLDLHYCM